MGLAPDAGDVSLLLGRKGAQLLILELDEAVLSHHSLGGDSLRVVPEEHVCEVGAVVDALLGRLTDVVAGKGLGDGLEAGLVEVGEGEAITSVQADLVGGGGQIGVRDVLHDVAREDGEDVGDGRDVVPLLIVLLHAGRTLLPVGVVLTIIGRADEEAYKSC